MATELECALANHAAWVWSKEHTKRVHDELATFDIPMGGWPYILACDFYKSHGHPEVDSRQQATLALRRYARNWNASEEFVYCLFALGFLAQDTIASGFAMAVALSNNAIIREPFEILYIMEWETSFWTPKKVGE